ncbi:hypothetical protein Avbf_07281 [Armadillidium vulgare]|nr:hypothetical protein Avbf_07281 [Armadillidium vulgare]
MIWVLLGVAILSATVGAFLTGIFFKCRRRNVISICSKSSPSDNANPQESGSDTNTQLNSKLGILRFSFRKMGICSKKSSLDPYRSESIQNTYSESPYINTDSSSTMYAEISTPLNGICGSSSLNGQPCSSDAYSEVPDPFNKAPNSSNCSKLSNQGIYCNSNYVTSEGSSEQNESSGGSTSTPSSAYYSDVSTSLEVHVNKRKKKKRKFEDKSLRLAPSQRLRKNYLPTSRSQQQHPCSSNERFMQNLRERNQNYYCTGNLIQNLMGKPRNEVSLADLGPSVSRDVCVPPSVTTISHPQGCIVKENKGTLVNKVPLCLHFGNVCSEQGHLISDIYTGETQAIENGNQGQCCSKNNPASLSQANDNIYADNMYCLENLCSAHAGCSHTCDTVFPQQSQIADLYQDKPGFFRFTSQNQVPENGFPHAEVAYFRQSKNKGCRCSVGKSVCCERESIKRKVLFPQQEIISKPDWNPSKENLHTFHNHPSKDCATTCDYNNLLADNQYVYTDGHINNGNIYFIKHNTTDPHHQLEDQTPNIYFGKNGKGENIYFTKANVCTPALPHPQLSAERTHPIQHTQQVANAEKGDSKVVQHSKEMKQSLPNMNDQQNENFSPTPSEYI